MSPTKFISGYTIVSKLYRDLGLEQSVSDNDIGEWIFDVLDDMKLPLVYIPRVYDNKGEDFDNYQVELPSDYVKLKWAIVDGCPAVLAQGDGIDLLGNPCYTQDTQTQWQMISSDPHFIDGFGNQFGPVSGGNAYLTSCGVQFRMNGNYIKFNQRTGSVVLLYDAFPVDENGFPMIPDVKEIKDAIAKYCTMKLDYLEFRKDASDRGKNELYKHSEREYFWAIGKAQNAIKMPDYHQMEMIKREHLRIMPNYNRYKQLFNNYGKNKWNI